MKAVSLFLLLLSGAVHSSAQVLINEVLYDPVGTDTGAEKIELKNVGSEAVVLTGYDLYPDGIGYFTFPEFTLAAGAVVVIHLRQTGAQGPSNLYHSTPTANMGNSSGSVALFNSTTHSANTIVDFVQWGAGTQSWASTAVSAGVWNSTSDFVPQVSEGHSIEYDGTGITSADWFDQAIPTIGSENALPVQLIEFNALASRSGVTLQWSTASELNNYGFEIERREVKGSEFQVAGSAWNRIGFIQGAGTTTSRQDYSYVDSDVLPGRYAYRIKQIDFNGASTYYTSTEVEVGLAPKELALEPNYPNPFNPATNIAFTVPEDGRVALKVYNMLGQEVAVLFDGMAVAGKLYQATFDASSLPTGVYVSRLEYGSQSVMRKMVFVR